MWMQNRINQTLNSPDALPRLEQILSQAERETGSEVGRRVCAALGVVDGHGRFQLAGCLKALRAAAVAPIGYMGSRSPAPVEWPVPRASQPAPEAGAIVHTWSHLRRPARTRPGGPGSASDRTTGGGSRETVDRRLPARKNQVAQ